MVVNGYEDGFDDLSRDSMKTVEIALNIGTESYVGEHGHWFPETHGNQETEWQGILCYSGRPSERPACP